jgi:hypothetical protein
MGGWVGALCLSSSRYDHYASYDSDESYGNEDRHKAPSSTPPYPLSLQDAGPQAALSLLIFLPKELILCQYLVIRRHWNNLGLRS